MFFTDQEKQIYVSPFDGRKYDPLRVNHLLTVASGNMLDAWVADKNAHVNNLGDVSAEGKRAKAVNVARAEVGMADAARIAFEVPPFDAGGPVDAVVLETLYHFLDWLAGKVETAGTPQYSPPTVFVSSAGVTKIGLPSA